MRGRSASGFKPPWNFPLLHERFLSQRDWFRLRSRLVGEQAFRTSRGNEWADDSGCQSAGPIVIATAVKVLDIGGVILQRWSNCIDRPVEDLTEGIVAYLVESLAAWGREDEMVIV
jgi:hypothetical protein